MCTSDGGAARGAPGVPSCKQHSLHRLLVPVKVKKTNEEIHIGDKPMQSRMRTHVNVDHSGSECWVSVPLFSDIIHVKCISKCIW